MWLKIALLSDRSGLPAQTPFFAEAPVTRFLLVRHGRTEWNRVERFRGRADVPLDEVGVAQAEATAARVAGEWQPAAIYASPLSRALRTAQAIAARLGLDVQPEPALIDIDYGEWQGRTPEEVRQRWPSELEAWVHAPQRARIPGGESLSEVRQRAVQVVKRLAEQHADQTVVLVAHTVVNRLVLLAVLGLGNDRFWRLRQEPCALNVFETEKGDFTLVSLNDACHLRTFDRGSSI